VWVCVCGDEENKCKRVGERVVLYVARIIFKKKDSPEYEPID